MAGCALWGVTALAHEEEVIAEPLIGTLNHSAAYLRMLPHCLKGVGGAPMGGVLLGNGSKPGDVLNDTAAPARAKTFLAQEPPLARYPFEAGAGAGAGAEAGAEAGAA